MGIIFGVKGRICQGTQFLGLEFWYNWLVSKPTLEHKPFQHALILHKEHLFIGAMIRLPKKKYSFWPVLLRIRKETGQILENKFK